MNKWRFPCNNYGLDLGFNTPGMETFRRNPYAALAREICQNSLDARKDPNMPVRVSFSFFTLSQQQIPGYDDLLAQLQRCLASAEKLSANVKNVKKMLESIQAPELRCLRISDFNTTGLSGVTDVEASNTPWYLITKGSGISTKSECEGGSKGIGKYASFVVSDFATVFYSTYTCKEERGYTGICHFSSAEIENSDQKTMGIGFFSSNHKNHPIINVELSLDQSFTRGAQEYGTDIYILGIREDDTLQKTILLQVLDSFICAIWQEVLEFEIDDILITKASLSRLIADLNPKSKLERSIIAQYQLLTENTVKKCIDIFGYGKINLFVKKYANSDSQFATNVCSMVRFPYMKIKDFKQISSLSFSALCIIDKDSVLLKMLREIENPEHNDWQLARLEKSAKAEMQNIMKEIRNSIINLIDEVFQTSENSQTDIEGAGTFLPDATAATGASESRKVPGDLPRATKVKRVIPNYRTGIVESQSSLSFQPGIGDFTDGDDLSIPNGTNQGDGSDPHPGSEEAGKRDGQNVVLERIALKGQNYRFFVNSKERGECTLVFTSLCTESNCELELFRLNYDGNERIVIESCLINGQPAQIINNKTICLVLQEKTRYTLFFKTNQTDLFACEVKLYALR